MCAHLLLLELLREIVRADTRPIDLGEGDGEVAAKGLEGRVTHSLVRGAEGALEVGLNLADGLHDGVGLRMDTRSRACEKMTKQGSVCKNGTWW